MYARGISTREMYENDSESREECFKRPNGYGGSAAQGSRNASLARTYASRKICLHCIGCSNSGHRHMFCIRAVADI
jgi:hypothetical protein